MSTCPVCGSRIPDFSCAVCGFDGSCNYEQYPTLSNAVSSESVCLLRKKYREQNHSPAHAAATSSPVSLLNKVQQKKSTGLLHCRNCGGRSFNLRLSDNALVCSSCKHAFHNHIPGQASGGEMRRDTASAATIPATRNMPNPAHRIAAREGHTIYVCDDGTVDVLGTMKAGLRNEIKTWRNIIAVDSCFFHAVGLRSDGTVAAAGPTNYIRNVKTWQNIEYIATATTHTVGVCRDGSVLFSGFIRCGPSDIVGWSNIVAVAAARDFITAGLRRNGTVVVAGDSDNHFRVNRWNGWEDIIAISAIGRHLAGLRRNGSVVTTGNNDYGQCNTSGWSNIIAVSAGYAHTVGLHRDGTVVAAGKNDEGQCDVSNWRDIIAVAAGDYHTVGLRRDGTLVAVGRNGAGQCNVAGIHLW